MRVRVRRAGPGPSYPFSLGCVFALVAVGVLFLIWLIGASLRSEIPPEPRAVATPIPAAPVVATTQAIPTPTRALPVVQATLAPPPPATATTVVIVVIQITATPVPPPPPLIVVTVITKP